MLASTGAISGGLSLAVGFGTLGGGIAISKIGELTLAGVIGVTVAGAIGATYMFSKPNSGRIRYSDGTGIDPLTGREATKERAYEIYHSLKDPVQRLKWKKWMKGKGWIPTHFGK